MGVYVFESKHGNYIKLGHYKGTNAWKRIAPQRGFYSTNYPTDLIGKVGPYDFFLIYWYADLGTKDESRLHQKLKSWKVVGEWYDIEAKLVIPKLVSSKNTSYLCDFKDAMLPKGFQVNS